MTNLETTADRTNRERFARFLSLGVRVAVVGSVFTCVVGIFLLTAGTDECWIIRGARGLAEHGRFGAGSVFACAHSTGGVHTFCSAVLHWLGSGRLEVIRLLGPLALAGLLAIILRSTAQLSGRRDATRWAAASAVLAVHGTFMLGSQAYGEVLATALIFGGVSLWAREFKKPWHRCLVVGLVMGMGCAVRPNCLPALAALPIGALLNHENRLREFKRGIVAGLIGALAFWIQWRVLLANSVDPERALENVDSYGIVGFWTVPIGFFIPLRLHYFMTSQDHLSLFVLIALSVAWAWARVRAADSRSGDVILVFAWLLWAAWVFQAPVAHLRYLWPALVAFLVVGTQAMIVAVVSAPPRVAPAWRRALWLVAAGFVVSGYLDGARTYLFGESDVLSFEWQRASRHSTQYGPFKHVQHQRSIVKRLMKIPAEQEVATVTKDTAMSFLTRRPIARVRDYYDLGGRWTVRPPKGIVEGKKPRWIVITPGVNRHPAMYLSSKAYEWFDKNTRLSDRFGPYLLYEVVGSWPEDGGMFVTEVWEPSPPHTRSR